MVHFVVQLLQQSSTYIKKSSNNQENIYILYFQEHSYVDPDDHCNHYCEKMMKENIEIKKNKNDKIKLL